MAVTEKTYIGSVYVGPDPVLAAKYDALQIIVAELVTELKSIIPRFEDCIVTSGSGPEFAKIATERYRAAIAKAVLKAGE